MKALLHKILYRTLPLEGYSLFEKEQLYHSN